MKFKNILIAFKTMTKPGLVWIIRDSMTMVRMHFLHAGLDSGLLEALKEDSGREELLHKLEVRNPELLDALLDLGLSLGELSLTKGRYRLKGRRSRALIKGEDEFLAALIMAHVTYYNSIYRHLSERLKGSPLGNYLEYVGDLVAKVSRISEPYIQGFIHDVIAGEGRVNILDIGCGSGGHLLSIHEENPDAVGVGIDLDEVVVKQAQENLANWDMTNEFRVLIGDIRNPPTGLEGSFDYITLFNLIYYFPVEDRATLFRSLKPMLNPGGALLIVSTFQGKGRDAMAANLDIATRSMIGCAPLPELNELRDQLRASGFNKIEQEKLAPLGTVFGLKAEIGSE